MPERVTLLDGVCPQCKAIIQRDELADGASVGDLKAAIATLGLVPVHYTAETPVPAAGQNKPNCPRA